MITKRTLLGYKKTKINSYAFDDLILQLKEKNRKFIEKIKRKSFWEVKGDGDMKFNVVVGNPPYQELVANNSKSVSQANPIYNLFVETASSISEKYVSMITPSLWMTGGTGLEQFRQFMLSNNRIIKLFDFEDSGSIFPTVNIAGGISFFLYDKQYNGTANITYCSKKGKIYNFKKWMNHNGDDIYIRDPFANSILEKTKSLSKDFASFYELVSTYSPFSNGVVGNYKKDFSSKKENDMIKIYRYSRNKNDRFAYIKRDKIIAKKEWIDSHKVFVSKAGEISARFNGLPFYGEPGTACNETYLVVGPFESKIICENVIKYMNTSLYKYLIV